MARIITTAYRYKRPPKKRKAAALTMPAVAMIASKRSAKPPDPAAAEDTHVPTTAETKPTIVTARKPGARWRLDVPDMTPEEHQRRGDAAVALFRELVRRSGGKDRDR